MTWWTTPKAIDALGDLIEHARDKAAFCIATGQPASEYDQLTVIEINEFIRAANRAART